MLAKISMLNFILLERQLVTHAGLPTVQEEYTPPELPVALPAFPNIASEQFGHSFRKAHFFLEPTAFLNHGAFGAALKEGLQSATMWREYSEQQPLRFLDREALPHLAHVIRRVAAFVGKLHGRCRTLQQHGVACTNANFKDDYPSTLPPLFHHPTPTPSPLLHHPISFTPPHPFSPPPHPFSPPPRPFSPLPHPFIPPP